MAGCERIYNLAVSETNRSPESIAQGTPADVMSRGERALFTDVGELRAEVKSLKESAAQNSRDFRWTWGGLAAGFLILAGFFLYGYNRIEDRFDQRLNEALIGLTKVETKMDDLSQRILPPPSPARNLR